MALFDKLRSRLKDVESAAMDATVSVEDLRKSDDELLAELEELAEEVEEVPEEGAAVEPPKPETPKPAAKPAAKPAPLAPAPPSPMTTPVPVEQPERAAAPLPPSAVQPAKPAVAAKPTPPPPTGQPPRAPPSRPSPSPPPAPSAGKYAIDPARVEDLLWDLELVLLEADVGSDVASALKEEVGRKIPDIRVNSKDEVPQAIEAALREAILAILDGSRFDFDAWLLEQTKRPLIVMFVGVNGTGKTTTIARIAHRVKELGFGVVLAAGDTFRAGAIEQLEKHGERLGLRVIKHSPGSDPAAVAYDAIEHAKSRKKDIVLLDTAGRMQTNANLMDEIKKVARVTKPDLTIFVGDSLAGNDAIDQARKFDQAVGVQAVVLTKVDTDAKGGAALSIAREVGKPVAFLGVGQEYADLIPFEPRWLTDRLFGT